MRTRFFLIVALSFLMGVCFAQSKKKKTKEADQSTTLDPYYPREAATPNKNKTSAASAKITYDNAEEEFYDRMEELSKTKRKNEKMMDKPQYSDPLYFGHKHPPKKHKPSKMKFCKVCGIRH